MYFCEKRELRMYELFSTNSHNPSHCLKLIKIDFHFWRDLQKPTETAIQCGVFRRGGLKGLITLNHPHKKLQTFDLFSKQLEWCQPFSSLHNWEGCFISFMNWLYITVYHSRWRFTSLYTLPVNIYFRV